MAEKATSSGELWNGRVTWDNPRAFTDDLKAIGNGRVLCTVRLATPADIRSHKALGYYWGVVLKIAEDETGQPADDIHAVMVEQFVVSERTRVEFYNKVTGECIEAAVEQKHSPKRGKDFYEFVEKVRQFLRDRLSIDTPDPDPEYWMHRRAKTPDPTDRELQTAYQRVSRVAHVR